MKFRSSNQIYGVGRRLLADIARDFYVTGMVSAFDTRICVVCSYHTYIGGMGYVPWFQVHIQHVSNELNPRGSVRLRLIGNGKIICSEKTLLNEAKCPSLTGGVGNCCQQNMAGDFIREQSYSGIWQTAIVGVHRIMGCLEIMQDFLLCFLQQIGSDLPLGEHGGNFAFIPPRGVGCREIIPIYIYPKAQLLLLF